MDGARLMNAVVASGVLETASERIMVRVSGALDSAEAVENVGLRVGDREPQGEMEHKCVAGRSFRPNPMRFQNLDSREIKRAQVTGRRWNRGG